MMPRWNLADLLDLEYLFGCDETIRQQEGEQALVKRDRIIYLAKIAPNLKDTINPRPQGLSTSGNTASRRFLPKSPQPP